MIKLVFYFFFTLSEKILCVNLQLCRLSDNEQLVPNRFFITSGFYIILILWTWTSTRHTISAIKCYVTSDPKTDLLTILFPDLPTQFLITLYKIERHNCKKKFSWVQSNVGSPSKMRVTRDWDKSWKCSMGFFWTSRNECQLMSCSILITKRAPTRQVSQARNM